MPTIRLENVSKIYRVDRLLETGVRELDLTIEQGEFVFVIGSSGAGKSTMLNLIAGNVKPSGGAVYVGNQNVAGLRRWDRRKLALTFGQVWQDPHLIRKRTIEENLEMVARINAPRKEHIQQLRSRVKKVLALTGVSGVEGKYPGELSGGECRRVELARALINSPPILILDELIANLDDDSIWDIFQLLTDINLKGTTIIMATHASEYVNIMRRRVVTLVDGHIVGDVKKGRYGNLK